MYINDIEYLIKMETLLLPNPDNIPTIYETKNKDFKIYLSTTDYRVFFSEISKQMCNLKFVNNIGVEVFTLSISLDEMMGFTDSIYQYLEFNMSDMVQNFNSNNTKLSSYNLTINSVGLDSHMLIINEYNPMYQLMTPRIKIEFDSYELSRFLDILSYSFIYGVHEEYHELSFY